MSDHHTAPPSDPALRIMAIETLLIEKDLIDQTTIEALIDLCENKIGPRNGAKVVARAWVDPDYKRRLLANGTQAINELGFQGATGEHMIVLENMPAVHNVTVCTLCSCYPWQTLGLPPGWYKSAPYRSRVVREPRVVLAEMGLQIPDDVEIRVWDANADTRYLVLPMRPAGTHALSEEELASLVTRDSMIGTGLPLPAGAAAKGDVS